MVQMAPPDYRTVTLPIERSLLFRYRHYKDNPEGLSMLRTSYRPWYYKKRLEEFEAIGVERDLAGLPIVKVPGEMLRAKPGTDQAKIVEAFKKLVRSVRRNEQEGVVFPHRLRPGDQAAAVRLRAAGRRRGPGLQHRRDHPALRAADPDDGAGRLHHGRARADRLLLPARGQDRHLPDQR